MDYFLTFIEGLISFISPCMLPMLPIYVSYFAGNTGKKQNVLLRSLFFVLGFTVVFVVLGVFAGTVGYFLSEYHVVFNAVCGILVICFGLSYLEILPLNFLKGMKGNVNVTGVFSSFLFGMIFSVSLTPCVGAFLGSALVQASNSASSFDGAVLLIFYSLGLGVPFVLSAVLLDSLSGVFSFIKRHYKVINTVCGIFLIIVGVLMAFGLLDKLLNVLR